MIVNVSFQAYIFFITIGIGIGMGLLYDIFRILRRTFKHPNFLIHVEDLIYWIIVACFFFIILFYESYGEIRAFCFLGALLGAGFYFLVFSPWVLYISITIIGYIEKMIHWIVRLVMVPVSFMVKLLSYPYRWIKVILRFFGVKVTVFGRKSCRYGYRQARKAKKNLSIMVKKV